MIETITTSVVTVWVVVAALSLLLFIAAADDSFGTAFWSTVIGLAVLQFLTVANPWGFVASHPYAMGGAAVAYLPIGVGWSMFRWWKLLQKSAAEIRKEKPTWEGGEYSSTTWPEYVTRHMPRPATHKEEIICWIAYWPFSAAVYLLLDFLQEAAEWAYARISRIYTSMADRVKETLGDDA